MSNDVRVVKSPLPFGVEKIPEFAPTSFVTTNVTLESGIVITNSEQFGDEYVEEPETESDDS